MMRSRPKCVAFTIPLLLFMAVELPTEQGVKKIRVRERKVIATLSVGREEHQLGFTMHQIGAATVPVGPRLRFVTPDRRFLWISDLVKRRLVLMSISGQIVKAIYSSNGYLPWDLSGFMDKEGSFYFWDKKVSVVTKVSTKGKVEDIRLDWTGSATLAKEPFKRDTEAFYPRCWVDDDGWIYVWVKTKIWFKGDDLAGGSGMLLRFNPKGEVERVVFRGENIDFVDRQGRIYLTKVSPPKIAVSVYDSYGHLIDSFLLKSPRQEYLSLRVRGKYLILRFESGAEVFYDAVTKQVCAESPGIYSLLGIRHIYEGGRWRSWTIDYLDESIVYLLSANEESAILESVTLEMGT